MPLILCLALRPGRTTVPAAIQSQAILRRRAVNRQSQSPSTPQQRYSLVGWVEHGNSMVRSANQSKRMISVSKGLTPCVTHHLPAVRSTHPTATLSASRPLRPPKGCRGPARRTAANAAPQFCRVGGARKFNGAFREPVEENDKRFQGFDPVRNPPFACGSLHAPYSYSFSLSAASAAQGLPGASATNRRQCSSAVL